MASAAPRRSPHSTRPSPSHLPIRNIVVAGHRTSVRLETSMWDGLHEIARRRGMPVNNVVTEIDAARDGRSLTAAIRVYVLDFYRLGPAGVALIPATGPRPS